MLTKASKRSPRFTEKGTPPSVQCVEDETEFYQVNCIWDFLRPKGLFRIYKTKTTSYDMKVMGPCIKTPQTAKNPAKSLAELI